MLSLGLYLKVAGGNEDIGYLFDITLSLSSIIIVVDVVLSILYFTLYNEITVVGILINERQRKVVKANEHKVLNSHKVNNE